MIFQFVTFGGLKGSQNLTTHNAAFVYKIYNVIKTFGHFQTPDLSNHHNLFADASVFNYTNIYSKVRFITTTIF